MDASPRPTLPALRATGRFDRIACCAGCSPSFPHPESNCTSLRHATEELPSRARHRRVALLRKTVRDSHVSQAARIFSIGFNDALAISQLTGCIMAQSDIASMANLRPNRPGTGGSRCPKLGLACRAGSGQMRPRFSARERRRPSPGDTRRPALSGPIPARYA